MTSQRRASQVVEKDMSCCHMALSPLPPLSLSEGPSPPSHHLSPSSSAFTAKIKDPNIHGENQTLTGWLLWYVTNRIRYSRDGSGGVLSLRLSSIILPDGKEAVSLPEIVVCRLTKIMRAVWEGGKDQYFSYILAPYMAWSPSIVCFFYFITRSNPFPALQEITTNPILALMQRVNLWQLTGSIFDFVLVWYKLTLDVIWEKGMQGTFRH